MVIVLIRWKIKPGEEHCKDFLKYWSENLSIRDRSHLVGEFISRPLLEEDVGFPCKFLEQITSTDYQSFVNVGVWRDAVSFKKEVYDPFGSEERKLKPFEFDYPERMVLSPTLKRTGCTDIREVWESCESAKR